MFMQVQILNIPIAGQGHVTDSAWSSHFARNMLISPRTDLAKMKEFVPDFHSSGCTKDLK
jgi:ATP-dependent phosphoenolpyruvate carboxykinase